MIKSKNIISMFIVSLLCLYIAGCGTSERATEVSEKSNKVYRIEVTSKGTTSGNLAKQDSDTAIKVLETRLSSLGINYMTIEYDDGIFNIEVSDSDFDQDEMKPKINSMLIRGKFTVQEVDEDKRDSNGDYLPTGKIVFDETQITKASLSEAESGDYNISLKLDNTAAGSFADKTEELIGSPLGMFLDERLISAPIVQARIEGGDVVISGNKSKEESRRLCAIINSRALPANYEIKELVQK